MIWIKRWLIIVGLIYCVFVPVLSVGVAAHYYTEDKFIFFGGLIFAFFMSPICALMASMLIEIWNEE